MKHETKILSGESLAWTFRIGFIKGLNGFREANQMAYSLAKHGFCNSCFFVNRIEDDLHMNQRSSI
jgi:nitrate/TMAO reductase-like tetraheme cytochrome c subunit